VTGNDTTGASEGETADASGEAERLRAELAAINRMISHDFREPVRSVRGFVGILKEALAAPPPHDTSDALELLGFVEQAADRMAELVKELDGKTRKYRQPRRAGDS